MILPDTNLLIYAHNWDDPRRDRAARWWSKCLSGTEPVVLCSATIFAFVRITTNRRVFPNPLTISHVTAYVMNWLEQPVVQFAEIGCEDVQHALKLLSGAGTAGNLTTDAQIAALSLRLRAVIHTDDTDYARFAGVRSFNPLTGRSQK